MQPCTFCGTWTQIEPEGLCFSCSQDSRKKEQIVREWKEYKQRAVAAEREVAELKNDNTYQLMSIQLLEKEKRIKELEAELGTYRECVLREQKQRVEYAGKVGELEAALAIVRDVIEKVVAHMDGYNIDGSYRGLPSTVEESILQDATCAVNWNNIRKLCTQILEGISHE